MQLIDIHRIIVILSHIPLLYPFLIRKLPGTIYDPGCKSRTKLHKHSIRITVVNNLSIRTCDRIFIIHAGFCPCYLKFKNTRILFLFHRQQLPVGKISLHFHIGRIRCIHTEHSSLFCQMCPKIFIGIKCLSL